MSQSIEERAREALHGARRCRLGDRSCPDCDAFRVEALRDAGLLLTPLAEEAMEAVQLFENECVQPYDAWNMTGTPGYKAVRRSARRIIESEKKDEGPWEALGLAVVKGSGGVVLRGFVSSDHASEAAAALNSLHRKERQP